MILSAKASPIPGRVINCSLVAELSLACSDHQLRQQLLFLVSQANESEAETQVFAEADDFSLERHPTPGWQLNLKTKLFTNGHSPTRFDAAPAQTNVGGTRTMFT